ncbi:restriction endonuclease subunit S [Pseudomonas japonica]|uniref:restriction endonuclease subunit S n=1 Tax=Pseudomonas japonica TaxID=256466 RepID=UPI0015E428F7|nr:restriction endonuclease subunit S [Pseudomonas japonica]MBA1245066.1 restriction endonuclease subunit S [Pseudomonas japonica]
MSNKYIPTMGHQRNNKLSRLPRLRFPEFQAAGPWVVMALDQLVSESRRPTETNDPTKRITVRLHLQGVEPRAYRGTESSEATNHFLRAAGQFIYGKQNIHKGAFGIIPESLDGHQTSQDLPCFDFKEGCHPLWLYYYFAREEIYGALALKMTGTGSKRLNEKTFLGLKVSVPDKVEQERIADCLSSLDELIAAEGQKLEALKVQKRGVMNELLPTEGATVPSLRFPDFSNTADWTEVRLEELAKRGSGHTPSKAHPEYYGGGIKWVSLADSKRLDAGLIDETETEISSVGIKNSSAVLHPAGSVLLSRDAGVGKSAVMGLDMAVSQHFIVWTCKPDRLYNWFLYYTLQHKKPLFEGIASGSTIKTIGLPFFINMRLALPTLPEQKMIADCLASLDFRITIQAQRVDALRSHKKGLMQQLLPALEEAQE